MSMERLTKWNEQIEQAELLSWDEEEWKDFMGSLDVPIATELSIAINKLAEYEDLEKQGMLLRLPCKVGDVAHEVVSCADGSVGIMECNVSEISIDIGNIDWKENEHKIRVAYLIGNIVGTNIGVDIDLNDFGKTVFLTKEAAEAALKEMG